MRISDWSSDVCSSDLAGRRAGQRKGTYLLPFIPRRTGRHRRQLQGAGRHPEGTARQGGAGLAGKRRVEDRGAGVTIRQRHPAHATRSITNNRSEEHTSELQSLIRISYAVFCLKKKKQYTEYIITHL